MVYKQKKNLKIETVYWMNFCIAGYLRIIQYHLVYKKTNFLEAIKYLRLSIGVIVLFEVFRPLRALKTEKKNLRGCRREEPIYLNDNVYES